MGRKRLFLVKNSSNRQNLTWSTRKNNFWKDLIFTKKCLTIHQEIFFNFGFLSILESFLVKNYKKKIEIDRFQ